MGIACWRVGGISFAQEGNDLSLEKDDDRFLRRALELARRGEGLASPNPCVGAVIVSEDGKIVGEGFHTYDGKKHGEVLAIERAGRAAQGAELYLNLEPCSHQGRTGPCAEAVIAAGIRRVVCSMEDPNPRVAGRGFLKLREAGIAVDVGLLQPQARKLNEGFAKYIRHETPLVTLKCAMTLDGKIALTASESNRETRGTGRTAWITGEAARAHVQELRHACDAVLTGIGTVLSDDPLLTDRSGKARRRPLLRVILDSHLRLPVESRIVQSAKEDVLVFCGSSDAEKRRSLEQAGVRVERVAESAGGHVDLAAVMRRLGELEILSVIAEGGSHLNTAMLEDGIADKAMLYFAPKIFGEGAIPFTAGLKRSLALRDTAVHQFGEDFLLEGYLRDPYSE